MSDNRSCPVCTSPVIHAEGFTGGSVKINCPRCKEFVIEGYLCGQLEKNPHVDYQLSAWLRWQKLRSPQATPMLFSQELDAIRKGMPILSVADHMRELLRGIAMESPEAGSRKFVGNEDVPLAWAKNLTELSFYVDALKAEGLIETHKTTEGAHVLVTPKGWTALESGTAAILDRAFVAMSFAAEMTSAWTDGLRPGIDNAGFPAHRVDSSPHIDRIDQKIVADIRLSRFVVADVTGQRAGVYFEAGLAMGFGKPVIWTVRKDEIDKVHFDTRQFAHVLWETPQDLETQLTSVILGVIGPGPRFKPA